MHVYDVQLRRETKKHNRWTFLISTAFVLGMIALITISNESKGKLTDVSLFGRQEFPAPKTAAIWKSMLPGQPATADPGYDGFPHNSAGSAKPGSLHGHINLPDPLRIVEEAEHAAQSVEPFHHHGKSKDQQNGYACMDEAHGTGPCTAVDKFGHEGKEAPPVPAPPQKIFIRPTAAFPKPMPPPPAVMTRPQSSKQEYPAGCFGGIGCYQSKYSRQYILCPAGSYCPAGTRKPAGCPMNTISKAGSSNVTDCEAKGGYFGEPGQQAARCPEDKYCPVGSSEALPCPMNTESPAGSEDIKDCTSLPGFRGEAGVAAVECSNNTYCPREADQYVPCPPKTQSPKRSSSITDCTPVDGAFGKPGQPAEICPAGSYCPPGSIRPNGCPVNTNSSEGSDVLEDCRAIGGYVGPYGQPAALCPEDFYCPAGRTTPRMCPNNTESRAGSIQITDCMAKAGYYGPQGVAAIPCDVGTYCPAGVRSFVDCPQSTTSLSGSSSVRHCMALAGFYADPGTAGIVCPAGFYCPAGSMKPIGCPDNTKSLARASLLTQCKARPGYYGDVGTEATACPEGSYCPDASTTAVPCPPNTESELASTQRTDCISKAGYYGTPGMTALLCPERAYCPKKANSYTPCPQNTTAPAGSSAVMQCIAMAGWYGEPGTAAARCPSGFFCPAGSANPSGCPANTESLQGSNAVTDCKAIAGYSGPWGKSAVVCDSGTWCPPETQTPRNCPLYTTSPINSEKLTDCKSIAGYYGAPGTTGTICLQSMYCVGGLNDPEKCPDNTNSPTGTTSKAGCVARAGFFGADGTTPTICQADSYCPSHSINPVSCPQNSKSLAGSTAITDCKAAPGYYGAAGTTPEPCPANQYCPGSGTVQMLCPANTQSPALSSSIQACTANAGYYSPQPGNAGRICPANFNCPSGAASPTACPPEKPITTEGSWNISQCDSTGWTVQLFAVPASIVQTPVQFPTNTLIGSSNLPQKIDFESPGAFTNLFPKSNGNLFSWRIFGKVRISTPGDYTFCLTSDDGSELFMNTQPIESLPTNLNVIQYSFLIDNDGAHGAVQKCRTLTLGVGSYYTQVMGFQAYGGAFLSLQYKGPDTNGQLILTPSFDSTVPTNIAQQTGGWTMQIYSENAGIKLTPVIWPSNQLLGQSSAIPAINFGSDQDVRTYVPQTPNVYAWRIFGKLNIITSGQYIFCTNSDDGSILSIDLQPGRASTYTLIVDNDYIHGEQQKCGTIQLANGGYSIKATGFQQGGGMAMRLFYRGPDTDNQITFVRSYDPSIPANPDTPIPGFTAQFFAIPGGSSRTPNNWGQLQMLAQINYLPAIFFNTPQEYQWFVPQVPSENFAWRIYGKLSINIAGSYTFCAASDDGSLFYLDGYNPLINNDNLHGTVRICQTVSLSSGLHTTRVEGFQAGGGVVMQMLYSGPDTGNQLLYLRSSDSSI